MPHRGGKKQILCIFYKNRGNIQKISEKEKERKRNKTYLVSSTVCNADIDPRSDELKGAMSVRRVGERSRADDCGCAEEEDDETFVGRTASCCGTSLSTE